MDFTSETTSNGIIERDFTIGEITGVLWSPATGSQGAPLLLLGHTGGRHNQLPRYEADHRARFFLRTLSAGGSTVRASGQNQ